MDALLINKDPLDEIFSGEKTEEYRGNATRKRGLIALVESGSGTVVGACNLVDVQPRTGRGYTYYAKTYAWLVEDPVRLERPVPYKHPSGAVIWVHLEDAVVAKVRAQLVGTTLEHVEVATLEGHSSTRAKKAKAPRAPKPDKTAKTKASSKPQAPPKPKAPAKPTSRATASYLLELDEEEQEQQVWERLKGLGPIERDAAVRTVAETLRDEGLESYGRLSARSPLYRAIDEAIDRLRYFDRIDQPLYDGQIRAVARKHQEFKRDDWRQCLLSSLGTEPIDRDDALRAAAEEARRVYGLAYSRLKQNSPILLALKSALNGAIRRGEVERIDARNIRRVD